MDGAILVSHLPDRSKHVVLVPMNDLTAAASFVLLLQESFVVLKEGASKCKDCYETIELAQADGAVSLEIKSMLFYHFSHVFSADRRSSLTSWRCHAPPL